MSTEKQTLKERLERELKAVQETSAAKQAELISEHGAKMEMVTQDHKQLLEAERSSNEDKLQKLREVIHFILIKIIMLNGTINHVTLCVLSSQEKHCKINFLVIFCHSK